MGQTRMPPSQTPGIPYSPCQHDAHMEAMLACESRLLWCQDVATLRFSGLLRRRSTFSQSIIRFQSWDCICIPDNMLYELDPSQKIL